MDFIKQLQEGVFNELIARFSAAIPKMIFAFIILLIGWIIASTIKKIVKRVLAAAQVDRLAGQLNDIDLVQKTGMRIEISGVLASMVYYVLMLGFIIFATDVLGIPAITDMVRDLINYLPNLFSAFVFLLIGLFMADLLRGAVQTTLFSLGIPSAKMVSNIVFYFLFLTVAVSALAQAKIDTGFIASNMTVIIGAGALAFSLGYGFASKDLVSNYLASYYNRDKIRIGDDVRIIGVRGKVVMLDSSSMILQTNDRAIVIPLSKITTEKVEVFYPDAQEEDLLDAGKES